MHLLSSLSFGGDASYHFALSAASVFAWGESASSLSSWGFPNVLSRNVLSLLCRFLEYLANFIDQIENRELKLERVAIPNMRLSTTNIKFVSCVFFTVHIHSSIN